VALPTPATETPPKRLILSLDQTRDADADGALLQGIMEALRAFPGRDAVFLRVSSEEKVVNLRVPNIAADYGPELHRRLAELVGEPGIKVEDNG